jgi:hypothetical protein
MSNEDEKYVQANDTKSHSKRWWSTELASKRKRCNNLETTVPSSKYTTLEYQCNTINTQKLRKVKMEHWVKWLDGLDVPASSRQVDC